MVNCSGRFLWYHSKFCFRMLLLRVVVLLFKILVWFVIEIGPLKALFKSSTWRELVGIQFALQSFENHLTGQRVRLHTHNQNVVRMYGSRSTYRTSFKVFLFISQRRVQLATLLILTTVPLTMKSLLNSTSSRVPIWLRDLLVVTMPSCVGLIPDSFSQVPGLSI